ncbi:MAG TPA: methyltransferase domain-containing protein [Conexibacter sp.]|jgi:SAM-dependent methyltransferase
MAHARYDTIGHGYAQLRREDPRIAARLHAAVGDARSVVNVGAGTGSYEPRDRHVIAVEPSAVMASQRGDDCAPAILASAGRLPLIDGAVDAAMAVLAVHHWDEEQEAGVRELRRVARGPVAILTVDVAVGREMWLERDYLTEVAELNERIFPRLDQLVEWLGGHVRIETVEIERDTPDWTLLAFWAHPERVLDASARAATSGFARMPPDVVARVVEDLERDLADGTWDARNGELRALDAYDAGLRLVVATPG